LGKPHSCPTTVENANSFPTPVESQVLSCRGWRAKNVVNDSEPRKLDVGKPSTRLPHRSMEAESGGKPR
jgi:hypothetical protein